MTHLKFIIGVQLDAPSRFREIFGEAVSAVVKEDLKRGFWQICQTLLARYQLLSEVICPRFGRWYLTFVPKTSAMTLDMDEQIPVLIETGEEKMRALLLESFGQATGGHQGFRLVIAESPEPLDKTQTIDQLIDQALIAVPETVPHPAMSRTDFLAMLDQGQLGTYFQPIVSSYDESVAGYEALTRGPQASLLHEADRLFGTARQLGLTEALEMACLRQVVSWMPKLPEPLWLAVNLGPELLMRRAFDEFINDSAVRPCIPRVVFELTEHLPIESAKRLRDATNRFRQLGLRLSLDDTGCGFFDLTTVEELHPEIVKLCITVISRIGRSPEVEIEMRETIQRIAQLRGSTLGEGVENRQQVDVLKQCGAAFAQGYFFGRPQPAHELFPPTVASNTIG